MFRINGIDLCVTVEDFGKIFLIPYRGAYIDLEVKGKTNYPLFKKHLDEVLLHRYN